MRVSKPLVIMLISLGILFGAIVFYKAFIGIMTQRFIAGKIASTRFTVSTMKVEYSLWQPKLRASGSVRAINGVSVTTELAGAVQNIYFTPGSYVLAGTKLVQLNADSEIGQMQSLQAQVELAKITYARDQAQYAIHAVSKQQVQTDEQNLRSLQGQLAQQTATVMKKTIVAPFSGRLGINNINLGQYLNPGDKIVSLQSLDPIYVDFYLPQQYLGDIKLGQAITITSNINQKKVFQGKITTIDSIVDPVTRNVEVEATVPNPELLLTPGIFGTVDVQVGEKKKYLTVPQTAISYNPYGDLVYVVEKSDEKGENDEAVLIAKQKFVTVGDTRGDQVAVLKGLKEGDIVVTSGQLKLKNNAKVVINNTVQPSNDPNPVLPNEY